VQHVAQIIYNAISPSTSSNLDAESELLQSIVGGLFAGNPLIPSLDPTYAHIATSINTLFQQLRGSLDNTSSAGGIATGLQTSALIPVDVSGAAPPTVGQVLTATSSASATWQNSGGGVTLATTTPAAEVVGGSGVIGVGTTAARDDHRHALPAFGTTSGTFCQGNDSRFVSISGSTPASEVVGGSGVVGSTGQASDAGHVHPMPAFGSSSGTFCQGNDSRLSDDRTASGIRSATTIVSVSSATAPSAGQVLTASSSTAAAWATPSGGGGGTYPGTYTYATLPSAVTAGAGNQQIVSDVPDCVFISDGSVWQPFCSGVLVTPPSVPVSSLTAYNSNAGSILTQEGPFWRLTTTESLNNILRAWMVGPIAVDGSGQYTIEMGIDDADTYLLTYYGVLGIFARDATQAACWFWYTQGGTTQGISAHYYSPLPNYSSSASTMSVALLRTLRFMRFGYRVGPVYTIDISVDAIRWVRVYSGTGWAWGFTAPGTMTDYGISLDSTNNGGVIVGGSSRMSARVCHLTQTAAPPPAPVL
jgi:hypothetical protein